MIGSPSELMEQLVVEVMVRDLDRSLARANARILAPDVDAVWAVVQKLGLPVEQPIADRYYGLRDFTVLDPDDFGLRFASPRTVGSPPPAA